MGNEGDGNNALTHCINEAFDLDESVSNYNIESRRLSNGMHKKFTEKARSSSQSFVDVTEVLNDIASQKPEENIDEEAIEDLYFTGWTKKRKRRFSLDYEQCVWLIFAVLTFVTILDRFVGSGDYLERRGDHLACCETWGTNVGETITNVIWIVTARLLISAQNLMFWTVLWCIPNIMYEHTPRWFKIYGIRDIHLRIHRIAGMFLIGIPAVVHVLVVFLPPLVDRVPIDLTLPSDYNYSSHSCGLNLSTWWDPAAYYPGWRFNEPKGVHLTTDEVWRILLMLVVFLILFPLSRSTWLNEKSYSIAMALHVFAGIAYAADNMRKKSHPLSHKFNLPVFALWAVDRFIATIMYRKQKARIVRHQVIGRSEYVILYVQMDKRIKPGVGDIYYLLQGGMTRYGIPQRSHPFTTFSNHSTKDTSWDVAYVVSIQPDNRTWFPTWSRQLAEAEGRKVCTTSGKMHSWGPYRSSHWHLYQQLVIKPPEGNTYYLLATGSGIGYILDTLGILAHRHRPPQRELSTFEIHFSVRCHEFIDYMKNEIEGMLLLIKNNRSADVTFVAYVTNDEKLPTEYTKVATEDQTKIHVRKGRFNVDKILKNADKSAVVYFDGSSSMTHHVGDVCEKLRLRFVKDFANARGSDKKALAKWVKGIFYSLTFSVAFCLLLNVYVDVHKINDKLATMKR